MFEPVTKQTLVDNIIQSIIGMVVKGELRPGHVLPSERELSQALNVSRASVREAVKALEYHGILEVKAGSGTYLTDKAVTVNSSLATNVDILIERYREDYKKVVEARRVLEVAMVALTTRRISSEGIFKLEESLKQMKEHLDNSLYDLYTLEDHSFHNIIAKNCMNDYLYNDYSQLLPILVDVARLGEAVPNRHWPSYSQHIELVNAIKDGNVEGAQHLMDKHIDYCAENITLYYKDIFQS